MRPVKQSALFRLALLALIWGSSFLWIKLADRGFAPVEVTFARLSLGAAALFPVVAARREALPRSAALWAQIALAAKLRMMVAQDGRAAMSARSSPTAPALSPLAARAPARTNRRFSSPGSALRPSSALANAAAGSPLKSAPTARPKPS